MAVSSCSVSSSVLVEGLLRHGEQYALMARDRGKPHFRTLSPHLNVCHICQDNRLSGSRGLDNSLSHLLGACGGKYAAHDVLVAILIMHTARSVARHLTGSIHHLREAHAVVAHAFGMKANLIFHEVAPHHRYLGHTARGEQPRTDGPISQCAQRTERSGIGSEADKHYLAHNA